MYLTTIHGSTSRWTLDMVENESASMTLGNAEHAYIDKGIASSSERDPHKRKRGHVSGVSYLSSKKTRCNGGSSNNTKNLQSSQHLHAPEKTDSLKTDQGMEVDDENNSTPPSESEDSSVWMNVQGDVEYHNDLPMQNQQGTEMHYFRLAVSTPTGHSHPYMSQDSFLSRMHLDAGYFDLI